MSAPVLQLYYYETCPFCRYVMHTISKLNLKVEMMHVFDEPRNMEKLFADTGRRTVPCMYIDGKPMFESADIMDWLEQNAAVLEKNS